MVLLLNQQRAVWLPLRTIRHQMERLLVCGGYADWDIGVHFVDNARIRQLNLQYRNRDKPTDILSFPFHTTKTPEADLPQMPSEDERNLGDMFLAMPYILQQCKDENDRVAAHLPVLLAHGMCHLMGYDHESDADYEAMRKREFEILNKFYSRF
ncbi:hypothetical protein GGI25_004385 [Coemansia spiralis]|uniref:Uncharacterized protein n=2 Tax=Coemansia TaxID=4863 RepID=A0A9W8G490_9FUNG|nr:rRNA maturation factor [Coemansia spiralis]KAJ1995337.1 hypothetical protein EDC05_000889 [Coemansia umbellata]KAJ2624836.1 hypothetical protein GGI26_001252 [Coemansia sp. RSA 1358]KAJ2674364.1 hypothetical protein GGI25_004385 [Coemansia spiralis]